MAKRLLFTGLCLLLVFMAQNGYTETRGIKVVARTPDGKALKLYDNSWAVVIGINKYQKWSALQYAVNDAKAVRDKLVTLGFPKEHIIFLTDAQATKDRIERVLGDELRRKMGKNDRVFIYFAGHGQTEDLPGDRQEGYIVPVDGDQSNLFSTCISMTTVRQFSERMAAKHVFYAIDACYSGLALVRAGELNPKDRQYLQKVARFPSRQLVTAGSAGEQVIERGGHGAFTKTLLIALDGSADKFPPFGVLTGSELGNYLKPVVSVETNNAQTPQFGRLSAGEGEFMFVLEGGMTEQVSEAERAKAEAEAAKREVERLRKQLEAERARKEAEQAKAEAERLRLELERVKEEKAEPARPSVTPSSEVEGMVWIPGGTFQMGSNDGDDERPVHTVTVDGFWIDKYEVTNARYRQFDPSHGSRLYEWYSLNGDDQPVAEVSWWDAIKYCTWRSRQEGLEEVYNETTGEADFTKNGYRLPTEAEWEVAARGGLEGKRYPRGDSISHDQANYSGTGGRDRWKYTAPVGSFSPNGYGLYDMAGNVREWCSDWYDSGYYNRSPSSNPTGPATGSFRVLRGGPWNDLPDDLRCANRRGWHPTDTQWFFIGFRCARSSNISR